MSIPILGFNDEYSFLSNMHPFPGLVRIDGILFGSSENYYQSMKTDDIDLKKLLASMSPKMSKITGRSFPAKADWNSIKMKVMLDITRVKFTFFPELKAKLIATGDSYLEETNTWGDTFWGVCNGQGHNFLGEILMQVRDEIR